MLKKVDWSRWFITALLIAMAVGATALGQVQASAQPKPTAVPGQSSTLLPDGRMLLAGGFGTNAVPTRDVFLVLPDEALARPPLTLNVARAGHTATVLPDGTVFIFGGVGTDGKAVAVSELYDPQSGRFSVLPDVFAVPRIFHSATLLTDGTVLLAGGVLAGGEFPGDVQLLDYRTWRALSQDALLSVPREGHTAALLSDGTVRLSGGTNALGKPAGVDEIYDPVTKRFHLADANAGTDANSGLRIAASIPEDGATDFPIQNPIAIRFSNLLAVRTAREDNFVLSRTDGDALRVKLTAAESGRLVFVLPQAPLETGTSYTLHIKGAASFSGEELPATSITFQTEGAPPDAPGLDFIPGSTWTTGTGGSKWEALPAMQAAPGVTALAGQTLKLNGWPLENVTIEVAGHRARTDSTGRFLLTGVPAGHQVMWVDGSTANHVNATYGLHKVGITIESGKTTPLGYTIWMTRLDTQHVMSIPSPTLSETVITNPTMPGLEVHLPAKTTITDRNGRIVHEVSLTPVPLDKTPFPLPRGAHIPMFFTIQPGGAYISVGGSKPSANKKSSRATSWTTDDTKGARLIYANMHNNKPDTAFDFWNYDPEAKGWFIYGKGKVSADGRSIVPNPGVEFYEFTAPNYGGSNGRNPIAPPIAPPVKQPKKAGEPVDLSTGEYTYTKTDMVVTDTVPIVFNRTYISNDSRSRSLGVGTTDSYDFFFVGVQNPFSFQELVEPDGGRVRFDRVSQGTDPNSAVYVATSSGEFYGAVLSFNTDPSLPGSWTLSLKNGTVMSFPLLSSTATIPCQAVLQIKDRYGNITKIDRDSNSCVLTRITSPNGRSLTFTNDSQNRITQLTDNIGRTVTYTYDSAGNLATVTDANSGVTSYTYDSQHLLLTITDPRNITYLTNKYDSSGRVIQQTQADGSTYLFSWTPTTNDQGHFVATFGETDDGDGTESLTIRDQCWGGGYKRYDPTCATGYLGLVSQVDVTDPRGYVRRVMFGPAGYATSDILALGQPEQQTESYTYYSDNLLQSITDALGRVTSFDYDSLGNITRVTRLDGTSSAVTSTFSYGGPFGQLSSMTDPLGNASTYTYDQYGNLTAAADALGHSSTFTYNSDGQISTVSDAVGNEVQFGYLGGDLSAIIDPVGNVSTRFIDAVGRVVSSTDAQGNIVKMKYNPLNQITQVTDPQGNNTSFAYDGNGNLLNLSDALNHTTSWNYDNMDRAIARIDSLNRQDKYVYDFNGNIASSTDRKGQVTSVTYDGLNRATFVGYNMVVNGSVTSYESTIAYTYDGGDRMTKAVDSAGGTITDAYDSLDRLTTETTAQGSISYAYDKNDRRSTMTVAGQSQVSYTYDNGDRLTQIAQGPSTIGFSYDNANRRTGLTLPNGVSVSYSYDNDSRVTGITYQFGNSILGNLTYAYDSLGRRTQVSGSFASTNLPGAIASASYDAANELTNWNGSNISYDANGNMQSDGTNTFTWNARNQVASVNSASLQYDAFGRRAKNGGGTSFLYDGVNATQELSGTTPTGNMWTGGIDELFQRTDSHGAVSPLIDARGSTVALVDSSGNLGTTYSYDPFGNTITAGAASANRAQYTGRENEGNGLYFYRERYYSPLLGRFINEDPAQAGMNFYLYADDNPVNWIDPFGLTTWPTDYHQVNNSFGAVEKFRNGRVHMGTDIQNPFGENVYASDSGVVTSINNNALGGNQIIVLNSDGSVSGYAHTFALDLKVGDHVDEGDLIGMSDASGHVVSSHGGDGAHLHYSFRPGVNCEFADPMLHLEGKTAPCVPVLSARKNHKPKKTPKKRPSGPQDVPLLAPTFGGPEVPSIAKAQDVQDSTLETNIGDTY
jgi:RHS repeat-associated protein